jgi:peptidoglycan/LPS O-acetylase OafA/YrhL
MTSAAGPGGKNNDIEVLRAFAIAFTLVVHLKVLLPANSRIHWLLERFDLSVGVDLFLVISGFVITGSLLESSREYNAPRTSLMFSFWIKRIFRLLPAAWLWVVIAFCCQLLLTRMTEVHYDLGDSLLRSAAALANVMNFFTPHCFASGGDASCILDNFVGHYWSLSLEEQFYLVFPLLFFFLGRRLLVCILIIAIATQFLWWRPFFSYAWYFKTDALCWGILLALASRRAWYPNLRPPALNAGFAGPAAGLLLLAALPLIAAKCQGVAAAMQPWGVAVVALLCAAIVWLASYNRQDFCIGGRYRGLMLYLGSRSYSLYLCHLVVYLTLRDAAGGVGEGTLLVAGLGLTFLCGELTYRFVETVFRARGRRIAAGVATRHQLAGAGGAAAVPIPENGR